MKSCAFGLCRLKMAVLRSFKTSSENVPHLYFSCLGWDVHMEDVKVECWVFGAGFWRFAGSGVAIYLERALEYPSPRAVL